MDRQIYEFQFSDLEKVTEAFNELVLASKTSNIGEIEADELIDKIIAGENELKDENDKKIKPISIEEMTGNLSAISKFASVIVPIGLQISPEEISIKEGLEYLPKIMEVNKDFFPDLLKATNLTSEVIVKSMKNLAGKTSTQ